MTRRVPRLLALSAAVALLAGCDVLGDADAPPATTAADGTPVQHLTVSVLPTSDQVALHIGIKKGFFKEEGLELDLVTAKSGGDSVSKLTSKEVDVAYSSYTPFLTAQEKVGSQTPIRLIADATANKLGYTMIAVAGNSSIKSVRDLAGKSIAVSAMGTMSHLATAALLRDNGVNWRPSSTSPGGINWVEVPFPNMAERLKKGDFDACYLVEPYVDKGAAESGAVPIADASGGTLDMPLTGFGALAETVERYRNDKAGNAIEKFQRAIVKATHLADQGDLDLVWKTLTEFANVNLDTAKRAKLPSFQTSLDPSRIQRVVRLMVDFGYLTRELDVSTMIVRPPVI